MAAALPQRVNMSDEGRPLVSPLETRPDSAHHEFDDSRYDRNAVAQMNSLSCCLSCIFPCAWLCSCFSIQEQSAAVVMYFGKYSQLVEDPGLPLPCSGLFVFFLTTGIFVLKESIGAILVDVTFVLFQSASRCWMCPFQRSRT